LVKITLWLKPVGIQNLRIILSWRNFLRKTETWVYFTSPLYYKNGAATFT